MPNQVTFSDIVKEASQTKREALITQLVAQLTLNEKIHQMHGGASANDIFNYGIRTFTAGGCERLGIPSLEFTDGPRGVMLGEATCFPVSMARGATWDPALEKKVGAAMGTEARAQGANLSGAVCINLLRHPGWGRAQETYGEDPMHLGAMGAALTKGLQQHIMACVKHFAANSIENSRFWVDVKLDERTLHEVYLPHFKECIDAGAASVMGAYNRVNGQHACHSKPLLTDILKNQWGFDGYVISDWNMALRGADAAAAGLDVEMPNPVFFGQLLKMKVQSGQIPESVLDEAVTRLVRQHARFATVGNDADYTLDKVACTAHRKLALEVARKGTVLLKNERNLLPLNQKTLKTIAVIGELAQAENIGDGGSSRVHPANVVTLLQGVTKAVGKDITVRYESGKRPSAVKKAAADADVVIIAAGLEKDDEGEFIPIMSKGGDRERLGLRPHQVRMIKAAASANKNCVVVVEGGSAITVRSWVDEVPALLMAWYPGMEGGTAIAEILFGEVNPSGKLPITFHRDEKQLPKFNRWIWQINYGLLHGYRLFDTKNLTPEFHFGHGLSYTTYTYANLSVTGQQKITVTVDVTNSGKRAGEEIVQLYAGFPHANVPRPKRELKAFKRVSLKPGQTKTVTFKLTPRDFAYYNNGEWTTKPMPHTLYVGPSSAEKDLALQATVTFAPSGRGA